MLSKDLNRRINNSLVEASTDEFPTLTKEQRIEALELSVDDAPAGLKTRVTALETSVDAPIVGLLARMGVAETGLPEVAAAPTNYGPATATLEISTGITLNFASTQMNNASAITISVEIVDVGKVQADTTIVVTDEDIKINATNSGSAITATLAEIKTKIDESVPASKLVTCTITGTASTTAIAKPKTFLTGGADATTAKAGKIIISPDAGKIFCAMKDVQQFETDGWLSAALS